VGRSRINAGQPGVCQTIHGRSLDDAIGEVLVEAMTPLALEVALTVQQELAARVEDADRLRRQQVERARYDADVAQRRFLRVDPENRLVADALEAAWNDRLRALAAAQEVYEQAREADARVVNDAQRAEILALASDFPRLWREPATAIAISKGKRGVLQVERKIAIMRREHKAYALRINDLARHFRRESLWKSQVKARLRLRRRHPPAVT
jgi:hypothetical protein